MDDNRYWLGFWTIIISGAVILVLGAINLENKKIVEMARLGYKQVPVMQQTVAHRAWQK
jgi:hypothetical protein